MSNSSDSFQLIKEDENEIKIKNSPPPISNYSDGYPKTFSNQNLDQVQENQEQQGDGSSSSNNNILEQEQEKKRDEEQEKKRDDNVIEKITAKMKFGKSEVEDDDEGFLTPTSLDQRIPVIPLKCPLAPRKPRPPSPPPPSSRKRKISRRRNVVKLDYSREIESLFPPVIQQDLSKKMKKARKGDNDANK